MRIAFDTNILAYAEGVNGAARRDTALDLIRRIPTTSVIVPAQVLGELFNVLVKKAGRPRKDARDALLAWRDVYDVVDTSSDVMVVAADLSADHHLSISDAVVLSVAARSGCRLLLSEDLQDGFTWSGVTVANPFADPSHPLLKGLLAESR